MTTPVDLTLIANVKNSGRVGSTVDDRLLKLMIPACSQFIRNYLSNSLPIANAGTFPSFTENIDGKNQRTIDLLNTPVQAVQSVMINTELVPLATDPTKLGFYFSQDRVHVRGWYFARGFQNVQVVYTAGYSDVPADVEQACREMIMEKYKRMTDRIGQRSASIQGQNITFTLEDLTLNVKELLMPYKRMFLTGALP